MNEQLTENNEIFNINPKNVLKILFSSNCRHLHNFLCAVILFGAFFSFLVLTLFIDSYRRFEVSDIETCEILEIPPFTQPQSGIYCCSVEVNPLVLMVSVLDEQILAFPSQDPVCACTQSDYQFFVEKFQTGFNYSCRVEQLSNYKVFLASYYNFNWIPVPFIFVFMSIFCTYFIFRVRSNYNKRLLEKQAIIPLNEGDL